MSRPAARRAPGRSWVYLGITAGGLVYAVATGHWHAAINLLLRVT